MTQNFVSRYTKSLADLILQESVQIELVLAVLYQGYKDNKKFVLAGNGGNFANILHFGTDWSKGLHYSCGKAMNLRVLGSNPALMSAVENDLGHQASLKSLLEIEGCDNETILILLSAGGTSLNILTAAETGRELGAKVIGIMGGKNFESHKLFEALIHFNSQDIQLVEDAHAIFGHMLLKYFVEAENSPQNND
jgi:D-sedoheptulose 7-phosphate isomerase